MLLIWFVFIAFAKLAKPDGGYCPAFFFLPTMLGESNLTESKYVKDELKWAGFTLVNEIKDFGRWKNESDKKIWFVVAKNNAEPKEN